MMLWRTFNIVLFFSLYGFLSIGSSAQASIDHTYIFKVFLEDEEIGEQSFQVSSNEGETRIQIEAQFAVKYWILTAYSYRHTNTELWHGDCLNMIRSQTNDNGEKFFVRGNQTNTQMKLVTHVGMRNLEGCIKTFAYWDQNFLSSRALLNSQTGEINHVKVTKFGEEVISVRTRPTPATHYHIEAEKFSIDLWYTSNGEWVALQSTTENDSRLRYVLQ